MDHTFSGTAVFRLIVTVLITIFCSGSAFAASQCISENAPGTPPGLECKCEANAKGASCITERGVGVICGTKDKGEACMWIPEIGCICFEYPNE